MTWWQSIFYGIVQGLTEFLPVSSSGHLVLADALFELWGGGSAPQQDENMMFFFVMLHLATAIAVIVGLWKPIVSLFHKGNRMNILWLIVATIPAGITGLIFNDMVGDMFSNWHWLWIFFLITAVLLFTTELLCKRSDRLKIAGNRIDEDNAAPKLKWWQALIMGGAQGCALFPGVSRSGSTICAGMLAGADKKSVADFSFMMSIPVILASALLEFLKVESFGGVNWFYLALGMCAAFLSGLLAIKLMLAIIRRVNYKWFSLYLVILSITLCILQFTT